MPMPGKTSTSSVAGRSPRNSKRSRLANNKQNMDYEDRATKHAEYAEAFRHVIDHNDGALLRYILVEREIDPDLLFNIGTKYFTPLLYAIYHRKSSMVAKLLQFGANPTFKVLRRKDDWSTLTTPFHSAIEEGLSDELITYMMTRKGIDLTIVDGSEYLVHELAELYKRDLILKKLNLFNGTSSRCEALLKLIRCNEPFEHEIWISLGFPSTFGAKQITYLYHQAAFYSRLDIIKALLIDHRVNIGQLDYVNIATKNAAREIIHLLPSTIHSKGSTALHGMIIGGRANPALIGEILEILDINVETKDSLGQVALHFACYLGQVENAKCLMAQFGARPLTYSYYLKKTVVQIAHERCPELFQWIIGTYDSKKNIALASNQAAGGLNNNSNGGDGDDDDDDGSSGLGPSASGSGT